MNEPTRHHYTPQFYLSAWCSASTEDRASKLWVVEHVAGTINYFRRPPKATGFEIDLYSFSDAYPGERASLETQFFSRLDNDGAAVVKKVIAQEPLTPQERGVWAEFVFRMRIRTPDGIALVKKTGRQALSQEAIKRQADYEAVREDGGPDSIFDWIETQRPGITDNFALSNLPRLGHRIVAKIAAMAWRCLDFTDSPQRLLCSDHPCLFMVRDISDREGVVVLPLSPRHAFVACYTGSKAEAALNRQGPMAATAKALNTAMVRQARQRAYCYSRGDAPDAFYAKHLVRQDPPRSGDRVRKKSKS
jgi:hypothetical protein